MSNQERCPHCNQPLKFRREGVFLTPKKAEIYDKIRHGSMQTSTKLAKHFGVTQVCIRAHIYQINDMFADADAGIRIIGGYYSGYKIVRKPRAVRPATGYQRDNSARPG